MLAGICLCREQSNKHKPPQDEMSFFSLTGKRSRRMTTTASWLLLVCLQLSLVSQPIDCYKDYGQQQQQQQQQVAAASSAASSAASGVSGRSGGAYAFSGATATANSQSDRINQQLAAQRQLQETQQRRQQQEDRLRRKVELKRARQAESMLRELLEMETSGTRSLADCSRWDRLNINYVQLIGGIPGKATRESELIKRQQCDRLLDELKRVNTRLDDFKRLALEERDHFEFVSNLVNQYVDLRRDSQVNEHLGCQFELLKERDEQIRISAENLDAFIGFMRQKLALEEVSTSTGLVASASESIHKRTDQIEELDRTIKSLVDREESLDDAELEQLNELGDMLEKILAEGHVDLQSGRFRYLTGTLDATRAVILRRLKADDAVEVVADNFTDEQREAQADAFAYADSDLSSSSRRDGFDDVSVEEVRPVPPPPRRANNYYSANAAASASAGAGLAATSGRSLAASGSSASAFLPPSSPRLPVDHASEPIRQQQVAMAGSQAFSGVPLREQQQQQHGQSPWPANASSGGAAAAAFALAGNNSQRQTQPANISNKQLDNNSNKNNNNHSNKQDAIPTGRPAAFASAAAAATASTGATSSAPSGSFGRWPAVAPRQRRFADHPAQQTKRD